MATVFKKTFTKPMPEGAERFTRKGEHFARWKDAKGRTRTEKVTTGKDGSPRLLIEADTWTAKYRDGTGMVQTVATGCRDETAARAVLAALVKRREHVKSGIVTTAQDAVIDQQALSISDHVDAYLIHLATKTSNAHRANVAHNLRRIVADCKFERLAHLDRSAVESWMIRKQSEGMGARTRNTHRAAIVAFAHWCVESRKLAVNPLAGIHKADEKADPRRHRRSLTEGELVKLLNAARRRPLLDMATVRRGKHKGQAVARLRPEVVARLEALGRERALIYKTLVLTGLRKSELASLTIGQLELDGPMPSALLHAADEKNRQGSQIALRRDLAADLARWIADKLKVAQEAARHAGGTVPLTLPPGTPLFTVPKELVRIMDRDLVAAGIARKVKDPQTGKVRIDKRDGRGWTVDVHALRTTFGTLLSKGGVAPRTAQAAMRHSSIDLTMNVYTDPRLLDVTGAMDALPTLALDAKPQDEQQRETGTCAVGSLAPTLAPTSDNSAKSLSIAGKTAGTSGQAGGRGERAQVVATAQQRRPLSLADNGRLMERAKGFEPSTFSLGS